jgi:very-short-patch-repair endonuclease
MANINKILYFTNPELIQEWDGNIEDMKKYTFKSDNKVNWKCKSGKVCHKWIASIRNRIRGETGCPYCSIPVKTICVKDGCWCNSLWALHPQLRNEWYGNIDDMKTIPSKTQKKFLWKCIKTNKDCHKYKSSPSHKVGRNQGCPYCINKKICSKDGCWCNSLWALKPELRKEWDGNIEDMKKVSISSNKDAKWKCVSGNECHKWTAIIYSRNKSGCPYCSNKKICSKVNCWCNSLWALEPQLRDEWYGNIDDMKLYPLHSGDKVKWKCKTNKDCHIYEAHISDKTGLDRTGCPFCVNKKICSKIDCWCNSVWKTEPKLKEIYDGDINDLKNYSISSDERINLKCKTGKDCHKWSSQIKHQTGLDSRGCPFCVNKKICSKDNCWCNSLWALKPELRDEWDGNSDNMKTFSVCSNVSVNWKCKTGKDCHKYESTINRKIYANLNCPVCYNRQICSKIGCWCNSLWTLKPELIPEWDGNIEDMKLYSSGSGEKVSWKCKKKHIYITCIRSRTKGYGCPYCVNKTEQKLFDIVITKYTTLQQQFKVEWCKNKTYLPFDFVIEDYKIIIELDGRQHFEQISNWSPPLATQANDKFKMKCANSNGYSIIRLLQEDVFYDVYDWLNELIINIEKIKNNKCIQNIFMCKDNEYEVFNSLDTDNKSILNIIDTNIKPELIYLNVLEHNNEEYYIDSRNNNIYEITKDEDIGDFIGVYNKNDNKII